MPDIKKQKAIFKDTNKVHKPKYSAKELVEISQKQLEYLNKEISIEKKALHYGDSFVSNVINYYTKKDKIHEAKLKKLYLAKRDLVFVNNRLRNNKRALSIEDRKNIYKILGLKDSQTGALKQIQKAHFDSAKELDKTADKLSTAASISKGTSYATAPVTTVVALSAGAPVTAAVGAGVIIGGALGISESLSEDISNDFDIPREKVIKTAAKKTFMHSKNAGKAALAFTGAGALSSGLSNPVTQAFVQGGTYAAINNSLDKVDHILSNQEDFNLKNDSKNLAIDTVFGASTAGLSTKISSSGISSYLANGSMDLAAAMAQEKIKTGTITTEAAIQNTTQLILAGLKAPKRGSRIQKFKQLEFKQLESKSSTNKPAKVKKKTKPPHYHKSKSGFKLKAKNKKVNKQRSFPPHIKEPGQITAARAKAKIETTKLSEGISNPKEELKLEDLNSVDSVKPKEVAGTQNNIDNNSKSKAANKTQQGTASSSNSGFSRTSRSVSKQKQDLSNFDRIINETKDSTELHKEAVQDNQTNYRSTLQELSKLSSKAEKLLPALKPRKVKKKQKRSHSNPFETARASLNKRDNKARALIDKMEKLKQEIDQTKNKIETNKKIIEQSLYRRWAREDSYPSKQAAKIRKLPGNRIGNLHEDRVKAALGYLKEDGVVNSFNPTSVGGSFDKTGTDAFIQFEKAGDYYLLQIKSSEAAVIAHHKISHTIAINVSNKSMPQLMQDLHAIKNNPNAYKVPKADYDRAFQTGKFAALMPKKKQ